MKKLTVALLVFVFVLSACSFTPPGTVQVAVNGSGNATVWAVDTLDVSISVSGDVQFFGSPTLTEKISSGGDLTALGSR